MSISMSEISQFYGDNAVAHSDTDRSDGPENESTPVPSTMLAFDHLEPLSAELHTSSDDTASRKSKPTQSLYPQHQLQSHIVSSKFAKEIQFSSQSGCQQTASTALTYQVIHLSAELRKSKKKSHAQINIIRARDEMIRELQRRVELLEIAGRGDHRRNASSQSSSVVMDDVVHDDEEVLRQRAHEVIVQEARAAKRKSLLQKPPSEVPYTSPDDEKKSTSHHGRRFSSSKAPVTLDLVTNRDRSNSSTFLRVMRKASNSLLRAKHRDEKEGLPPLPTNPDQVSKESAIHDARDSGYGSIEFGATPRASMADGGCNQSG
jgi:hypothetical protein